jgi:hypothetical protein
VLVNAGTESLTMPKRKRDNSEGSIEDAGMADGGGNGGTDATQANADVFTVTTPHGSGTSAPPDHSVPRSEPVLLG